MDKMKFMGRVHERCKAKGKQAGLASRQVQALAEVVWEELEAIRTNLVEANDGVTAANEHISEVKADQNDTARTVSRLDRDMDSVKSDVSTLDSKVRELDR